MASANSNDQGGFRVPPEIPGVDTKNLTKNSSPKRPRSKRSTTREETTPTASSAHNPTFQPGIPVTPNPLYDGEHQYGRPRSSEFLFQSRVQGRYRVWKSGKKARRGDNALGMTNKGTDCFRNAAVQCLLHLPVIVNWLETHNCNPINKDCFACRLRGIAISYWTEYKLSLKQMLDAFEFWSNRRGWNRHGDRSDQQDSHEYLEWLLDGWRTKLRSRFDKECFDSIFTTKRASIRVCESQHCWITYFKDIALNLPTRDEEDNELRTITDCFTHLFRNEEDEMRCPKCNPEDGGPAQVVKKKDVIEEAPEVLICTLNRFKTILRHTKRNVIPEAIKLNHGIAIDEPLDLTPYANAADHRSGDKLQYRLAGMTMHTGDNANHGHYIAIVRSPNDEWSYISDEEVVGNCQSFEEAVAHAVAPLEWPDATAYVIYYTRTTFNLEEMNAIAGLPPLPNPNSKSAATDKDAGVQTEDLEIKKRQVFYLQVGKKSYYSTRLTDPTLPIPESPLQPEDNYDLDGEYVQVQFDGNLPFGGTLKMSQGPPPKSVPQSAAAGPSSSKVTKTKKSSG